MHCRVSGVPDVCRSLAAGALALVMLAFWPSAIFAAASEWPLEGPAEVVTAFGANYAAEESGGGAIHRGADLRAEAGAAVLAPCAGEITFVGRVPAVGSSGTVLACTIQRADGARFTLMPLADAFVAAGRHVEAGQHVGDLAERGDGSASETHLHVGARRGDLYVDPLGLLTPPSAAPDSKPAPEPIQAPSPVRAPVTDPAPGAPSVPAPTPSVNVQPQAESPASAAGDTQVSPAEATEGGSIAAQQPEADAVPRPDSADPMASSFRGTGAIPSGVAATGRIVAAIPGASYPGLAVGSTGALFGETAAVWGSGTAAIDNPVSVSASALSESGGATARTLNAPGPTSRALGQKAADSRPSEGGALVASLVSSAAGRGAPLVRTAASRLARAWLTALVALLVAAGALWPLWRHGTSEEEPALCLAPVGE